MKTYGVEKTPGDITILQTGLYTKNPAEVKRLATRVEDWNIRNIGTPIQLDVIPFENGDPPNKMDFSHFKFRFKFPSKKAQENFWLN